MAIIAPIITNPFIPISTRPVIQQHKKTLPFTEFKVLLPQQEYKTTKIIPIPFDNRQCNGGRFISLNDAMIFICKHCYIHHSSFTKSLAKMYLPFCRIMKFTSGKFETPNHLKKAEFEEAFLFAQHNNETTTF